MDESERKLIEIQSDLKYIRTSVDEIKSRLGDHDKRIRELETFKESMDAIDSYKKSENAMYSRRIRNYYTLFLVLFTGVNILIEVVIKIWL